MKVSIQESRCWEIEKELEVPEIGTCTRESPPTAPSVMRPSRLSAPGDGEREVGRGEELVSHEFSRRNRTALMQHKVKHTWHQTNGGLEGTNAASARSRGLEKNR